MPHSSQYGWTVSPVIIIFLKESSMNNQRNATVEPIFRLAKDFCFMLHFSIPLYLTGTRKSLHKQFSWNRFFQLVTFFFHWNLTTSCTDKADGKLKKWYWCNTIREPERREMGTGSSSSIPFHMASAMPESRLPTIPCHKRLRASKHRFHAEYDIPDMLLPNRPEENIAVWLKKLLNIYFRRAC